MSIEVTTNNAEYRPILPFGSEVRQLAWSADTARSRSIYGFDSRDMRSRPFNLLRSKLLKLYRSKKYRLFGIVSATPGVGKSFIATNLAASISRTPGLTTFLCDLDLRRGSIAQNFDQPDSNAVRQFLEGDAGALKAASFTPEGERLIVLPTDSAPVRSAELLSNSAMDSLVAAFRHEAPNALVICDLPPVFANDDAAIIIGKLDAYVLVVENGQSTKKQVREAVENLGEGNCAGVVLNRYNSGMFSDSYGYRYGPGYNEYFEQK